MSRSSKHRFLPQGAKIIAVVGIFLGLAIGLSTPNKGYPWGSENFNDPPYSAHYFIIDKAVEYLIIRGLSDWPLEYYAPNIRYGAYWADYPYDPIGLECNWADLYEGTCDGLHHYASTDCIRLIDIDPNPCIGNTGGLAAPQYGQALYDLAVKFWPGGMPVPDIHDLSYMSSGGSMTTMFDGESLGPFVVGALPFAAKARAIEEGLTEVIPIEWAYTWPGWTDGSESLDTSLIYLGWAIHFVEDMSAPVHVDNETGSWHATWEEVADQYIMEGNMSHLPVSPEDSYSYPYLPTSGYFYTTRPEFFNNDWNVLQFAQESARLSRETQTPPGLETGDLFSGLADVEVNLDTAIKMVAGVIYKFFSQFELPKDSFEPNNLPGSATPIASGFESDLTIHAPLDSDFYEITVTEDFSRVRIIVNYDISNHNDDLALNIEYTDCEAEPCVWIKSGFRITDTGGIYEEEFVPAGRRYLIEVSGFGGYVPVPYSMNVYTGNGDLPPDRYEENNTDSSATVLPYGGCNFTGKVNIHSASDIDYYQIDWASGYSIQAEISFDPNFGELDLYLDGIQATESITSDDGTKKTLRIKDCGKSLNYIMVQGAPNFYDFCIHRIPIQEGCPGYFTPDVLKGRGTFTYTDIDCDPGQPPAEQTSNVKERMRATITSESPGEVFWTVGAEFEDLGYLIAVELHCERGLQPTPAQVTIKLLHPYSGDIWWQGSGMGECYGPESPDVITGFSAAADLTSIVPFYCIAPGNGTLTIEGYIDTDNDGIADQVEIETGINPNSDDTDGDGIPDGVEDANQNGSVDPGETDPGLWDTDGDSVSDGVESGLTSPRGNDTDQNTFRADEDPATTTDPNSADTDGDGIPDGVEDANQNGRVDPGETSPLIKDVTGPDLIIESLTHAPLNPTTMDTITFTAVVKNIGDTPAESSTMNFRIGGETFGQDFPTPALAPDESYTVQRQLMLGVAQNYLNRATADVHNDVTESNEGNNVASDSYTVLRAGDLDGDNDVDMDDVDTFRDALGSQDGDANYNPDADFDGDGRITMNDYRILRNLYSGGP